MAKLRKPKVPVNTELSEEAKKRIEFENRPDPRNHDYPVSQEQWDVFFKHGSWAKLDPGSNTPKKADSKGRTIIEYPDEE